jgi:hypothetical protein
MAVRVRASSAGLTLSFLTLLCALAGCSGSSSGQAAATADASGSATTTSQSSSSTPAASTTASQTVSAALTWTVPSRNTDGSSLTNLAGYRIYYGADTSAMTSMVQVVGASTTSYVVQNLTPGTYYFAIKSYNIAGTESDLSGVVSTTI